MQELRFSNGVDDANHPTGGSVDGIGIAIRWQNGPLGNGAKRQKPNGAFVEGVIQAAIQRLQFYQESEFACKENEMALVSLRDALHVLNLRTSARMARNVEGTHSV